jgi:hypothetical protein
MAKLVPTVGPYEVPPLKRVSWGAIFGGTFMSLAVMVLLGSLGLAVGATSIDPQTGETPSLRAFGIGAGVWWLVSGGLALFGGAWAASKLAGPRRRLESTLHGLVTWSFTTTLAVILMSTVVGSMISGAMRVLGIATSYVAQDTRSVNIPGVDRGTGIQAQAPDPTPVWQEVWGDAQQRLREARREQQETGTQRLGTEPMAGEQQTGIQQQGQQGMQQQGQQGQQQGIQPQTGIQQPMVSPQAIEAELEVALSRMFRNARHVISDADKRAVADILVTRTNMNRDDARELVDDWAEEFQKAYQPSFQVALPGAAEPSRVQPAAVAEGAANAVANAAWWTFFYLILTAGAAGGGGYLGSLRRRNTNEVIETRSVTP